jgi:activator of HSP90 ATPase
MSLKFEFTTEIPASAAAIYNAWLDSKEHALMTESESAVASHEVGANYKAHGEYISGKNLELVPNVKIRQSWRSDSFKDTDPDSIVEVLLEEKGSVTQLTLIHSGVPEQESHVEKGWIDYYFEPMKRYFGSKKQE